MPKSKKEMMRALRVRLKGLGLRQVTYWLLPEDKQRLDEAYKGSESERAKRDKAQ